MNYEIYKQLFDKILAGPRSPAPYDKHIYLYYTQANRSRMKRLEEQLYIDDTLLAILQELNAPLHWIILTEPWCDDAGYILPFLMAMIQQTPRISYDIQLRDQPPFLIEQYLTRGSGRDIPKLIVRDAQGVDLFVWGPRPKPAQQLMEEMLADQPPTESIELAMQNWYKQDQGRSLCKELEACFQQAGLQKDL